MFLYGCARRQQVYCRVDEMMKIEGDRSAAAVECVKALKSTAGVFKHIHAVLSEQTVKSAAVASNR